VVGVCVRRSAELQRSRIDATCQQIASLLKIESNVCGQDIHLLDEFLKPGYGIPNPATIDAIILGAQTEGLMLDPVYTGKAFAAVVAAAKEAKKSSTLVFMHTGGAPALFAYQDVIESALEQQSGG